MTMQDLLVLIRPDMLMNYLAVVAVCWTSGVLINRWSRDRDTLTMALFIGFSMQGVALFGSIIAELAVADILSSTMVEFWSAVFIMLFVLSFPSICYFYTGLFHPRNKWHLPLISFLAGNTTMFALLDGQYYEPATELTVLIMICGISVYGPLAISCFHVAPLAARRMTRMKFKLVGMSSLLFCLSFLTPLLLWIFAMPADIQQIGWSLSGLFLSLSYIVAWVGWTMPEWARRRLQDSADVISSIPPRAVEVVE